MQEGDGGRDRLEDRKGEGVGRGFERVEAGKRENEGGRRRAGREEAIERGRERGGRGDMETWGRSNRGGMMNNGMRNAWGGREGVRPEHRGVLPGLSSSGQPASLDGGVVIDGSYFQTSIEASKPPLVKQKLSEALSLISLARRLQGPARVGYEQWSDGRGWDRGEENSRKMYSSIGDVSVSAAVSERDRGEEDSSSEGWWKREQRFHNSVEQSDSETGSRSKESPSELSLSGASSPTSSVTAEHDKTESDTETEKNESDSGTEKETLDTDRESESGSQAEEGSESEKESGLESEDEGKESGRKSSDGQSVKSASSSSISSKSRRSSAKRESSTSWHDKSNRSTNSSRYSGSTASSSRPKTSGHSRSSHETIEEESEEEEEEEEVKSAGGRSRRASSHIQSDVIDTSDDLSPIIEDTEEEEKSHGDITEEGNEEEEEERDLENETAD